MPFPLHIKLLSQKLRNNCTPTERELWKYLRKKQFKNLKFLRQHPICHVNDGNGAHFFIADFYCHEIRLLIELDGLIHEKQKEQDRWRDNILSARGFRTLRIGNEELENIEKVLNKIENFLISNPL